MKKFPYLLMLVKLCPGDCDEQLDRTNKKMDEDNGRGGTQENGLFQKLQRFSGNNFWNNIGCLMSVPTFGLWG